MKVDTKNILYKDHESQVAYVNAVYEGVDSAANHLQQYTKEEDTTYKARKDVATLNNFVRRVVNSIKNIVFRQPLDITTLEGSAVWPYLESIDLTNSINIFAKDLLATFERDNCVFIFIDAPIYSADIVSKADEISAGLRPYMKKVERSKVLNWKYSDKGVLTRVTIEETYLVESEDSFEEEYKIQHRVLEYGGRVAVYRGNELYEEIESSFTEIPLVQIGELTTPNLYDLAKLNINHMNRGSELNNYIRIGAAPIPVTWGMNVTDGEIRVIGVNQGINFTDTKANAGFEWVEMTGSNAEMIRDQLKADEEAMLDITVNLITSNQPRTATEVNADNVENESRLVASADILEEGLNSALNFFADYLNTSLTEEQGVVVNKDFDSNKLTDTEVQEYRADYLAGVISWDTLIETLITGKRYKEMTTEELAKEKANLNDPGV